MMLIIEQFVHSCCGNASHLGHSHGDRRQSDSYFEHDSRVSQERDLIPEPDVNSPLLGYDSDDGEQQEPTTVTPDVKHVQVGNTVINDIVCSDDEDDERGFLASQRSRLSVKSVKSLAAMQSVAHSNFRSYVLVFAISLHSLFEGLAVGLIPKVDALLQIFIALFIHKSILSFSLGVKLVDGNLTSKAILICIVIFGAMAPLGVGLGLLVTHSFEVSIRLFFSGVMQGIATGTFLYVTFFEVLPTELNIEDDMKPLKILFVLIGYILVTGMCYYENRFRHIKHIHPATPTGTPGL